jgi:cytosine/adenosine deaminase-related metal-dependent hydrolase
MTMTTLLVRTAHVLVTMDGSRREIADGGMFVRDGVIEQVGASADLPETADTVFDATGLLVLPGLINTHHHLVQTLTRAVPGAQHAKLFDWLRTLYPVWANLGPEAVRLATTLGSLELAKSGCTTVFDHQYLWPNGSSVAHQFEGVEPVGVRFHASRGSMSLSEKDGGLPPDSVVQTEGTILAETMQAIDDFHDPAPGSMNQVVIAPCSPFTVTEHLMLESAALARDRNVRLHTHLAETRDEEQFTIETYGKRPVEYAADLGWLGDDVWFAHAVFIDSDESARMAETGTGVAHCPGSNMRLASGIPPIARYLAQGVPVGLGVDGSASNDSNNLLNEARMAMLMQRLGASPDLGDGDQNPVRTSLEIATIGGARVLGRTDIGSLEVGKRADFFTLDLGRIEFAGALHDPVAAALLCGPVPARDVFVDGAPIISDYVHRSIDERSLAASHNAAAFALFD